MRNVIKVFRKMFKETGVPIDRIEFDITILEDIAYRCGFELSRHYHNNKEYIHVSKRNIPLLFISDSDQKVRKVRFACLSDIHAGNVSSNLNKLEDFLTKAQKLKIKYVFISGDLFDGIGVFEKHEQWLIENTPTGQAQILFNVLRKYQFHYIVINGNHEYSFEILHQKNPIYVLDDMMKEYAIKFDFIDTFCTNVIINGIGIQLVHLDATYGTLAEYPCLKYVKTISNLIEYKDKDYKINVIIAGHIHQREAHECKNQLILQPGSIKNNPEAFMGFIISLKIEDGNIKECLFS